MTEPIRLTIILPRNPRKRVAALRKLIRSQKHKQKRNQHSQSNEMEAREPIVHTHECNHPQETQHCTNSHQQQRPPNRKRCKNKGPYIKRARVNVYVRYLNKKEVPLGHSRHMKWTWSPSNNNEYNEKFRRFLYNPHHYTIMVPTRYSVDERFILIWLLMPILGLPDGAQFVL